MITDNILPKDNLVLIDKAIDELSTHLMLNLPWLSNAFGKAYKLVKVIENREISYPAIYMGNNEYSSVLPNEALGNYVFFEIRDPQNISTINIGKIGLEVNVALVFWYNQSRIFGNTNFNYTEDIKQAILTTLNMPSVITSGRFTMETLQEEPSNIFKGYSIKQIDTQYLMYPYAGLRVEGIFKLYDLC